MRRTPAVATAVVIAIGAGAAADGATPAKMYQRLNVSASFTYHLDYGSHPRSVYNGKFSSSGAYSINAITVYDGRTLSVPRGLMVAAGGVVVLEDRTVGSARKPVVCKTGLIGSNVAKPSSGHVSVSNRGLVIDPGAAVPWNPNCSATESLPNHGLPGGKSITVKAPPKSALARGQVLTLGCQKTYKHDFERADQENSHSFEGSVVIAVKLTPFPATKLDATKAALRAKVGGESLPGPGIPESKLKNC